VKTYRVKPPGATGAATYSAEALVVLREMVAGLPDYSLMLSTGHVSSRLRRVYREAMAVHEFKAAFDGRLVGVEDHEDDFPIPLEWLRD
jgi:hypothetical protein